jgi:membrane-bound ClpP family serine protease
LEFRRLDSWAKAWGKRKTNQLPKRRYEMTTKKILGLIIFLLGAGTLAYLALFKVGSGLLGVGGGVAALVGYALLFGFSTGRKAVPQQGK